jgi:hypothetical protein
MQLLISKCSQANGKWTDQFTRNWELRIGHWALGIGHWTLLFFSAPLPLCPPCPPYFLT